ncbi:MAG: hypothetical protein ACE5GM_06750 [bacterium]
MKFQHTEPDPDKLLTSSKLYFIAYRLYSGRITIHQALTEFAAWVDHDFREDIAGAPLPRKLLFFLTWLLSRIMLSVFRPVRWLFFQRIFLKVLLPYLFLPVYRFLTSKWLRLLFSPRKLLREVRRKLEEERENRGYTVTRSRSESSLKEGGESLLFSLFYHLLGLSELSWEEVHRRFRKTIVLIVSLVLHLSVLLVMRYQKPTKYDLSGGKVLDLNSIQLVDIGGKTLDKPKSLSGRKPGITKRLTPAGKLLKKIARLKPVIKNKPKPPPPTSREKIPHEPEPKPKKIRPALERRIAIIQEKTAALIRQPAVSKLSSFKKSFPQPSRKRKVIIPGPREKQEKRVISRRPAPGQMASVRKIETPMKERLTVSAGVSRFPVEQSRLPADKSAQPLQQEVQTRQHTRQLLSIVTQKKSGKAIDDKSNLLSRSRVVLTMADIGIKKVDLSREQELASRKSDLGRTEKQERRVESAEAKIEKPELKFDAAQDRKTVKHREFKRRESKPVNKLFTLDQKKSDLRPVESSANHRSDMNRFPEKAAKKTITDIPEAGENTGSDWEAGSPGVTYLDSGGKQSFSALESRDSLEKSTDYHQVAALSSTGEKAESRASLSRISPSREKTLAFDEGAQALEKILKSSVARQVSAAGKKRPLKRKQGSVKIDLTMPRSMITREALYTLTGKIDQEARMAWIKVNGITQLAAVVKGRLVAELSMKKGINEIEVTAFGFSGGFGRKKIKILFQPLKQVPVVTLISPSMQVEKAKKGDAVLVKGEIDDLTITKAVLFLNRRPIMLSVRKGKFSQKTVLPGKRLNTFRIMATNRDGVKGYSAVHTVLVGADVKIMNPRPF